MSDTKWKLFCSLLSVGTNQGTANMSKVLLSSRTVEITGHLLPSTFSTILIYIVVAVDEFSWDGGMFSCSLILLDQQFLFSFSCCFLFFLNICANARKYHRFQPHFSFPSSHHEQNMLPEMLASALVIMYSLFPCVRSWLTEGRKGYLG